MASIKHIAAIGLMLASAASYAEFEQQLDAQWSMEVRGFLQSQAFEEQSEGGVSLSFAPEWLGQWDRGDYSVSIAPFARFDSMDGERSHVDLREFYWQGVFGDLEVRAGISKVFWGKTELLHLVDIINQTDAVENIDGEDKLGQPMLRLNWAQGSVNLQAYLLPWFRERPYAGASGRLRPPLAVKQDDAIYQSGEEQKHLDYALRLQGYAGALDYGLSWFSGTSRNPQLLITDFVDTPQGPQPTALQPFYGQLDQLGLDAQYTLGSWLFKLEAAQRRQGLIQQIPGQAPELFEDDYTAATGGFEYSRYGVLESNVDVGYLIEYLWDERNDRSSTGFQNDIFIASRIAANDVNDSTLLGGIVVDLDKGSRFISLEAARRIDGSNKISLEMRLFSNINASDVNLAAIEQDDYVQLELIHYF